MNSKTLIRLLTLGAVFLSVACKRIGPSDAPPVPESVKPLIAKTQDRRGQDEFLIRALQSDYIYLSMDEHKNYKARQIRILLFEDRQAEVMYSSLSDVNGFSQGPLTRMMDAHWRFAGGDLILPRIGILKINGEQALLIPQPDGELKDLPAEVAAQGIVLTMKTEWLHIPNSR